MKALHLLLLSLFVALVICGEFFKISCWRSKPSHICTQRTTCNLTVSKEPTPPLTDEVQDLGCGCAKMVMLFKVHSMRLGF